MQRCFIIFLCLISTITFNVNSFAISPRIQEDSLGLTLLFEVFWSSKPKVLQKIEPLNLCPFIDQCCSTESRSAAISSLIQSMFKGVDKNSSYEHMITQCVDSSTLKEAVQYCPSMQPLFSYSLSDQDRSNIRDYIDIMIDFYTLSNDFLEHIYQTCIDEEIHAFLCLSNTTLMNACITRTLQETYENIGYTSYQKFIRVTRNIILKFLVDFYA